MTFIDIFSFMATSLQKLLSNLDQDKFHSLSQHFIQSTDLLLRKGVYRYEYMDSFEKFEESQLPPLDAFSSTLSSEEITAEDYQDAQNMWKAFNMKSLGVYHNLYVETDILQMSDVFENFRKYISIFIILIVGTC